MLGDTKFSPIQRTTAAQAVANQILGEIRRGVLRPGAQLPAERDLMQQLNVGRSSVREALQILATLNPDRTHVLAAARSSANPRPPRYSAPELFRSLLIANSAALELMEARLMVEPAAVRLACVRATAEDLDGIADLLGQGTNAPCRRTSPPEALRSPRSFTCCSRRPHTIEIVAGFMGSIIGLLMARGRKVEQACRVCTHRGRRAPRDIATRARDQDGEAAAAAICGRTSSTRRKPMIPTAPRCRLSPSTRWSAPRPLNICSRP